MKLLLSNETVTEFDPRAIVRLTDLGGKDLARKVISLFLESTPQRLKSAIVSHQNEDLSAVAFAAHSLRSSAANVGAIRIQRLAADIEQAATLQEREQLTGMLQQLSHSVEHVCSLLEGVLMGDFP